MTGLCFKFIWHLPKWVKYFIITFCQRTQYYGGHPRCTQSLAQAVQWHMQITFSSVICTCNMNLFHMQVTLRKNELVHSHTEHLCQPLLYCSSSSWLKWPNGTRRQTDLLNWRRASNARSTPQSPVQWHVKEKRRADQTTTAFWNLQLPVIYTRAGVETASVSRCHSQMFCGHSAASLWQLRI